MIDIWKYKDLNKIILTDVNNTSYKGQIVELIDADEKSDLEEQEDSIVLAVEGKQIEFLQSEIKAIQVI